MDPLQLRELHLADQPDDDAPLEQWVVGVVVAVHAGPPLSVDLHERGDTSVTIPNVRYASSYSPTVGDTVYVLLRDEDRVVVFDLA